jgi:RNA polymerase sigma-70 factor (ECF subfamily)
LPARPDVVELASVSKTEGAMSDAKRNDGLALEEFRDYLVMLARMRLGRVARNKVEASDVVQETMLEALRKRDQFRGQTEAEMAGWLRQLLAYNLADAARAAGRAKRDVGRERSLEAALAESSARLGAMLAAEQTTPSQAAGRHEDAVVLARSLTQLPEHQREALVLRHCEGCSLDEISPHMGRTPDAVAGLLKRGLRQLRLLLEDRGD